MNSDFKQVSEIPKNQMFHTNTYFLDLPLIEAGELKQNKTSIGANFSIFVNPCKF
jgi:hypothetical protein